MTEWRWVTGAMIGVRDENALESALARPINLSLYGEADAASLAASLAFGLARNHPFVDGNKRSPWVGARLFLRWNDIPLEFDKAEATVMVQRLAAGVLTEDEVAVWFRERIV